jgi:transketolase
VSAVMDVDPLADKYRAFGWNVLRVDGHDIAQLQEAFRAARNAKGRPTVVIADTVKGKGVSFMENQAGWHGVATKGFEQLEKALREIACPACTPDHARKLLAGAEDFQKRIDAKLAGELPRYSRDFWWNAGPDMKVEMVATRTGFGACLDRYGDDPRLVTVHADISSSISIADFERNHPDRQARVVSVGIAEQDMMSVAAGLALEGRIPITGTYGVFASGRPWDQIRTTICYDGLNVKIAGAHGGVSVGGDGATHQALEEISLMAVLPNMTLVVPADAVETERLSRAAIFDVKGPAYIRYAREATPVVTSEATPLELGTANVMRFRGRKASFRDAFETFLSTGYADEGEDLAIAACGPILCEALRAAVILKEEYGLETRVLDVHTVKPLDGEALRRAARETGAVLTCEEHQKGGFGNLVAGVICGCGPVGRPLAFDRLGMEDRFGESGRPWELMIHFGFTAEHIAARAKRLADAGKSSRGGS